MSQGGTKAYVVVVGRARKLVTLGKVSVVSQAEARAEAKKLLAGHALGRFSPQSVRFNDAVKDYLKDISKRTKPNTHRDYKRVLNTHFVFKSSVKDIRSNELKGHIDRLSDRPREQAYAHTVIKAFFNWCIQQGYTDINPVVWKSPGKYRPRERVLTLDELKEVYSKCGDTTYGKIVKTLILTGQRKSEIASLHSDWIDDDLVTLPDTKNGRSHTFPLSKTAQENMKGTGLLFPGREGTKPFNGWSKAKKALDESLEGVEPFTLHDLRRTFATTLASLGTPIHVTEKLLNHVSGSHGGIVGVYQKYEYLDEMREAVALFESQLV